MPSQTHSNRGKSASLPARNARAVLKIQLGIRKRGFDMKQRAFILLLFFVSQLVSAQEFRSSTVVSSPGSPVRVDMSSVTDLVGSSVTIRNSSGGGVNLPQLFSPASRWPYGIADIQKDLPTTYTDEDFAIASWRFVINHVFHYCSAG